MAEALNYTSSSTVESLHKLPHYDLKLLRVDSTFATNDPQYLVSNNLFSFYFFRDGVMTVGAGAGAAGDVTGRPNVS